MANSRSDSSFAVGGRPFRGSHRLLLLLFLLMPQLPIWLEGTCHDGVGVGMTSSPPPFPSLPFPPPLRYLLVSQLAWGRRGLSLRSCHGGKPGMDSGLLSLRLLPLHIWNRQGPPYTSPPSSHSGETSSVGPNTQTDETGAPLHTHEKWAPKIFP